MSYEHYEEIQTLKRENLSLKTRLDRAYGDISRLRQEVARLNKEKVERSLPIFDVGGKQ